MYELEDRQKLFLRKEKNTIIKAEIKKKLRVIKNLAKTRQK
jgi:hypothetical protein